MQNFGATAKSIMVFLKKAYLLELLSANLFPPLSMCQMHGAFLLLMARDRVRVEKQEGKIDCCVFVSVSVLSGNITSSCPSRQEKTG